MKALTGTKRLFKLTLRLDRTKLAIWVLAIVGIIALTLPQLINAYSSTADQIAYTKATSSSAVTRLLGGAITGPSIGEITIIETYVMLAVLVALMNIFLVSRHTRLNEETGRSELIGSMVVGRQSQLTATLLVALGANTVVSGLLLLVFLGNGFDTSGAALYCLGIGLLGMLFAAITAVSSQLFESARGVNGITGLVLGASFMIRGIADLLGTTNTNGLGVVTNKLSWLSPLGWVTNMKPFANENWWALVLFAVAIPGCIATAYALLDRRDVGASLLAARAGKARASRMLLRPLGLIWKLNRTSFLAWGASIIATGAMIGAVANEFADLIAGNEEMQKLLATIGGGKDPSNIMFSAMFTVIALTITGYTLALITKMKSEETSSSLELTLSAPVKRTSWLARYIFFIYSTAILILLFSGFAAGVAYGLTTGNLVDSITSLTGAIAVHAPSIGVVLGIGVIAFGGFNRMCNAITWGSFAVFLSIFQLGSILNLPNWLINISPFSHTPAAPADSVALLPLVIQSIVAIALCILGAALFRRRDIST